uniref:Uncharacterized protein n=1 Tax=Anguilla anguilla TaxID=7936 RepID=A0A0E9XVR4_ANGAN
MTFSIKVKEKWLGKDIGRILFFVVDYLDAAPDLFTFWTDVASG